MSTDPLNTFGYILTADNVTIGYLKRATFPTLHLFEFEAPLLTDQRFLDSLNKRGYMPFQRWSLITLNLALQEIGRVVWNQARVMRIRFPELNNNSAAPLRTLVQMAVAGVREVDPASGGAGTGGAMSHRPDPLPLFAFELKVDGLGSTFSVSRINAFAIGDGASEDLVLTVTPEANADLFRDWLRNGNTPRGGSLIFLNTALQGFFTIRLTGLRVGTVTPAVTTHSPNPATVRLQYSDIRFATT